MEWVTIFAEPKLTRPVLIAAWPGIGQVALRGVTYLKDKLGATTLASISPLPYFDLNGVLVENNMVQPLHFPESIFSYWHHPNGGQDLIIFTGEAQPSARSYEYAGRVLDVAHHFGVKQVFTLAAALVSELPLAPQVWGAVASSETAEALRPYGVTLKGDFYIAGMNGLLLAVALERHLETVCLLGETPRFAPQLENPAASVAILEVLTRLLDIPLDLAELKEEAKSAQAEIEKFLLESRKEFIDRFTVPLWEQSDEEEKA